MDTQLLIKLASAMVLPPGSLLVLMVGGLVLRAWWPRLGLALVVAGVAALYGLSVAPVAGPLLGSLEDDIPAVLPGDSRLENVQAIVVLGGGRRGRAPEYGGETVSPTTLERVRYAALLHRETGLPLAVTGGVVLRGKAAEAELMARVLREDFSVPVRWVEGGSRNTEENALNTWRLLGRDGVSHVALVTHANHLPRAVEMFRDVGFDVLPAPTAWLSGDGRSEGRSSDLMNWMPSAATFAASRIALHEHVGRLWYRLRRDR